MKSINWYTNTAATKFEFTNRDAICYHKVTSTNTRLYLSEIKQCIKLFKSEIDWEEMWDIKDVKKRFDEKHIMYIMTDNDIVLGFCWYNKNYLYNVFVSKTRTKNDSQNFIKYTLNEYMINYKYVILQCDDWNIKAQKFFRGIGFINLINLKND